jgi:hypothetical protein
MSNLKPCRDEEKRSVSHGTTFRTRSAARGWRHHTRSPTGMEAGIAPMQSKGKRRGPWRIAYGTSPDHDCGGQLKAAFGAGGHTN